MVKLKKFKILFNLFLLFSLFLLSDVYAMEKDNNYFNKKLEDELKEIDKNEKIMAENLDNNLNNKEKKYFECDIIPSDTYKEADKAAEKNVRNAIKKLEEKEFKEIMFDNTAKDLKMFYEKVYKQLVKLNFIVANRLFDAENIVDMGLTEDGSKFQFVFKDTCGYNEEELKHFTNCEEYKGIYARFLKQIILVYKDSCYIINIYINDISSINDIKDRTKKILSLLEKRMKERMNYFREGENKLGLDFEKDCSKTEGLIENSNLNEVLGNDKDSNNNEISIANTDNKEKKYFECDIISSSDIYKDADKASEKNVRGAIKKLEEKELKEVMFDDTTKDLKMFYEKVYKQLVKLNFIAANRLFDVENIVDMGLTEDGSKFKFVFKDTCGYNEEELKQFTNCEEYKGIYAMFLKHIILVYKDSCCFINKHIVDIQSATNLKDTTQKNFYLLNKRTKERLYYIENGFVLSEIPYICKSKKTMEKNLDNNLNNKEKKYFECDIIPSDTYKDIDKLAEIDVREAIKQLEEKELKGVMFDDTTKDLKMFYEKAYKQLVKLNFIVANRLFDVKNIVDMGLTEDGSKFKFVFKDTRGYNEEELKQLTNCEEYKGIYAMFLKHIILVYKDSCRFIRENINDISLTKDIKDIKERMLYLFEKRIIFRLYFLTDKFIFSDTPCVKKRKKKEKQNKNEIVEEKNEGAEQDKKFIGEKREAKRGQIFSSKTEFKEPLPPTKGILRMAGMPKNSKIFKHMLNSNIKQNLKEQENKALEKKENSVDIDIMENVSNKGEKKQEKNENNL